MTPEAEELLEWIDWEGGMDGAMHHGFFDYAFPNDETKKFHDDVLYPAFRAFEEASIKFLAMVEQS